MIPCTVSAQILIPFYAIGGSFFHLHHIIGLCEVYVICVHVCCEKVVIPMFMCVLHTDVSCLCVCVDGYVYVCACAYAHARVCVLRTAVRLHGVAFNKDNLHVRTHSLCHTHTHTHTHTSTHTCTPTLPPTHLSTHPPTYHPPPPAPTM